MKKWIAVAALLMFSLTSLAAGVDKKPRVALKTSSGDIVIELDREKAPVSVDNFLQYVRDGYYNGLIFHRVINGFMIQGGGYKPDMTLATPRAPIVNEAKNGLRNDAGTIAMARTSDPNSASSQFFINLVDNPNLNYPAPDGAGYAVFGKVVSGFDVVQAIGKTKTGYGGMMPNVPNTPVVINSASVVASGK